LIEQTGNYPVVDVTSPLRCDFTFARSSDAAKLHPRSGLAAAWVLPEGSSCASRRRKIRDPVPSHASVGSAESVARAELLNSPDRLDRLDRLIRPALTSKKPRLRELTSWDCAHVFLPLRWFARSHRPVTWLCRICLLPDPTNPRAARTRAGSTCVVLQIRVPSTMRHHKVGTIPRRRFFLRPCSSDNGLQSDRPQLQSAEMSGPISSSGAHAIPRAPSPATRVAVVPVNQPTTW